LKIEKQKAATGITKKIVIPSGFGIEYDKTMKLSHKQL